MEKTVGTRWTRPRLRAPGAEKTKAQASQRGGAGEELPARQRGVSRSDQETEPVGERKDKRERGIGGCEG